MEAVRLNDGRDGRLGRRSADALATTGLKAFWDARAANLVVVPKAYRTDSKAARAKQAAGAIETVL